MLKAGLPGPGPGLLTGDHYFDQQGTLLFMNLAMNEGIFKGYERHGVTPGSPAIKPVRAVRGGKTYKTMPHRSTPGTTAPRWKR